MKRYYISKIIGNGTIDNPYRPKLADSGVNFSVITKNPPTKAWALCIVDTPNHTSILGDADNDALPDLSLDLNWNNMSAAVKDSIRTILQNKSIPISTIKAQTLYREIIRLIGVQVEPSFSENNFDVSA